jgi:DNA repair exonuclease SbcCD nuclease subunit
MILVFSDLHIDLENIQECISIMNEIKSIIADHKVDELVTIGDIFDKCNPSSEEINAFCNFLKGINAKTHIVVAPSHESITPENNIFKHFELLNPNIKTYFKELILYNIYFGHFTVKESLKGFNETKSIHDFANYRYILLGHQHTWQKITDNSYHIGSSRWVRFDEDHKINKKVAIIHNDNIKFIDLKSPIKMLDVLYNSEHDLPSNSNLKVRLIFKSYSSLLNWLKVSNKYKNYFHTLKIKIDFENLEISKLQETKKVDNYAQELLNWLDKNNIDEKIKNLIKGVVYGKK